MTAAIVLNLLLLGCVSAAFYAQDLKYAQPTPRPRGYVAPSTQTKVMGLALGKPTLLCFGQPDCPCTRFNQDHLFALAAEFRGKVDFIEVVEDKAARGLSSPGELRLDPDGTLAKSCGVYSTPQAVILGATGELLFRCNFNAGRYCSDPSSEYARIALEAVVANRPIPVMPSKALTPYGCAIGMLADWGEARK